jgi:LAO/AO transport system kinase
MTDQPQRIAEVLAASRSWRQARLVIGVTGAPGSGKSTLVDHLAAAFRSRYPARRLGIVAVDPSSPFTGGAILGDRVRMMRHATDGSVFIRSLASRGQLGGLAAGAQGIVRVMGLIGCDVVIVETVGVGQSEVEIARNADLTIVVLAPGQGDSVQMLKAGLIEAGDLFVVNKADREDAPRLQQQLLGVLRRGRVQVGHGRPQAGAEPAGAHADAAPVLLCSAARHEGVEELLTSIEDLATRHGVAWQAQRRQLGVAEVRKALLLEVTRRIEAQMDDDHGKGLWSRLLRGETTLAESADRLLIAAANASAAIAHACPCESDSMSQVHDLYQGL